MASTRKKTVNFSNEDILLVKNVKEKACNESITKLIEKHKPLCIRIYKKYSRPLYDRSYFFIDFEEDIPIIFLKAIDGFDINKGCQFASWLGNHVRYYCLNIINAKKILENSIENHPILESLTNSDLKEEFFDFVFDIFGQLKDQRIKKIFEMRYLPSSKTQKWKDVAKTINISIPTVMKLHGHGIDLIKNKIKSKIVCDNV